MLVCRLLCSIIMTSIRLLVLMLIGLDMLGHVRIRDQLLSTLETLDMASIRVLKIIVLDLTLMIVRLVSVQENHCYEQVTQDQKFVS